MTVHRELDGSWSTCDDVVCLMIFHLPLTVAEAEGLSLELLLPLLEVVEPPSQTLAGMKMWCDPASRVPALHRDHDLPAMVAPDSMRWFRHGLPHRDGGRPAIVYTDVYSAQWIVNGELHRDDDLPAAIHPDGSLEWYQHGNLHREGGPARVMADGRLEWYVHGGLRGTTL